MKKKKATRPVKKAASVLGRSPVMAFLATTDFERAKTFFAGALGLKLLEQDGFAQVYDAAGTLLRVVKVEDVTVAPYTVLGWRVKEMKATVKKLIAAGVKFEIYRGFGQDELGIWTAPGGTRVAWFKDPDGNLLSISDN